MADVELVKRNADILRHVTTPLKRVASTGGGEYAGPCPMCGGTDRFRVQPNHADGGLWLCHSCAPGKYRDVVEFIQRLHNTDFMGAMDILDGGKFTPSKKKPTMIRTEKRLKESDCDSSEWQSAAQELVATGIAGLWADGGALARKYLGDRGLSDETLVKWGIGFIPGKITIPCYEDGYSQGKIQSIKYRLGKSAESKYSALAGGRGWLYGGFTYSRGDIAYLLESNFDVLLADQFGINLGFACLPAGVPIESWYLKYFNNVYDLVVIPDNDDDFHGINHAINICKNNDHWHVADFVPRGSDLTEYYLRLGDDAAFVDWLLKQCDVIKDGSPHE